MPSLAVVSISSQTHTHFLLYGFKVPSPEKQTWMHPYIQFTRIKDRDRVPVVGHGPNAPLASGHIGVYECPIFIPGRSFTTSMTGFVFKLDYLWLGYYRDQYAFNCMVDASCQENQSRTAPVVDSPATYFTSVISTTCNGLIPCLSLSSVCFEENAPRPCGQQEIGARRRGNRSRRSVWKDDVTIPADVDIADSLHIETGCWAIDSANTGGQHGLFKCIRTSNLLG